PSATEASRYPHPFRILLGPLLAAFSGLYSEAALNIALPSLMGVFDIPATVVQWLTTGYILAVGVVLPMFGLLLRWIPTRKPVVTAIVLFLVGATIAATAPSFAILLAGRIIQGVATGIMLPLVFNTAIAVYPVSRTGTAMGTIGLVVMFAPTVSPVIAGLLLDRLDWTWIFWSMVPVLLGALLISLVFLKDVRELSRPKVDALSLVCRPWDSEAWSWGSAWVGTVSGRGSRGLPRSSSASWPSGSSPTVRSATTTRCSTSAASGCPHSP
ncbi:MAG: MFS transporter, partial [Propionibacterium sp.]|nr:MFS transporter [Propionibacterium sp.]